MNAIQLAPTSLCKFQLEFGDYLRRQIQVADDMVPSYVGGIYQELIFNNILGFLNQCFPICKRILDDKQWQALCLYFFQRSATHSPYFSEIPKQFVEFLLQFDEKDHTTWCVPMTIDHEMIESFLPSYLPQLAHYEWLELFVDTMPNQPAKLILSEDKQYYLNSSMYYYQYGHPVHMINSENQGNIDPQDVFLVVLRDGQDVKFVEVNALTYLFIDFLHKNKSSNVFYSSQLLMTQFADSIDYENIDELMIFCQSLLDSLVCNKILLFQV